MLLPATIAVEFRDRRVCKPAPSSDGTYVWTSHPYWPTSLLLGDRVDHPRRTPTPSRLRENSEFRAPASGTGGPPGDSRSPISSTSLFKLLFTSCFSSYPIPHPFCQFLIILITGTNCNGLGDSEHHEECTMTF